MSHSIATTITLHNIQVPYSCGTQQTCFESASSVLPRFQISIMDVSNLELLHMIRLVLGLEMYFEPVTQS